MYLPASMRAGLSGTTQMTWKGPAEIGANEPTAFQSPEAILEGTPGPNGQNRHRQGGSMTPDEPQDGPQPEAGETLGCSGAVGPGATRWIFSVASM